MNILEHEIEDLIWNSIQDYDYELLQERGLPILAEYTYKRQLVIGNYGIADLVGFKVNPSCRNALGKKTRYIQVQVIELKKDAVTPKTFFQAVKYVKGLQQLIRHENIDYFFEFFIVLVGKTVDASGEFIYLSDVTYNLSIYTYSISLKDGLEFNREHGYKLTSPGFKNGSTALKDILKENVNGRVDSEREGLSIQRYMQQREKEVDNPEYVSDDLPF